MFRRDISIMAPKMLPSLQAEKSKTLFVRSCLVLLLLLLPPLLDLQGWLLFKQSTQVVATFISLRIGCHVFDHLFLLGLGRLFINLKLDH